MFSIVCFLEPCYDVPMLMRKLAANMTEIQNGKFRVMFSYNTPVAAINSDTSQVYRTNAYFSKTTSAHINKWFQMIVNDRIDGIVAFNSHIVSQTEIEAMTM